MEAMRNASLRPCAAAALLLAACSSSTSTSSGPPANVAGSYTVDVTDGSNGCNFANWNQGAQAMNIAVSVSQNGSQVTATVNGVTGLFMTAGIGTNTFSGSLAGSQASMTATGTVQGTQGSCTFTTNATVDATFNGDTMQGTVTYTRVPAMQSSSCASLQGCQTVQSFSGARPPTH
jgi:hypothetical protein